VRDLREGETTERVKQQRGRNNREGETTGALRRTENRRVMQR